MSPLLPLVSLRYTGSPQPTAGLYLNDLPGISITSIDAIANSEQGTFLQVWQTVQTRACQVFTTSFINTVSKRFRLRRVAASASLGTGLDLATIHTTAPEFRGFTVSPLASTSPLLMLCIDRLSFYGTTAGTTVIKVYEVANSLLTEIDSIAITATVGWTHLPLNKSYAIDKQLFIGYDATAIATVALNPSPSLSIAGANIAIQGAKYDGTTFTTGVDSYGLSGSISLQCSFEPLIALLKNQLALAYWYLLGAEMMVERIYTDRINRYTTIDIPRARALREEFRQSFQSELMSVVEGLDINTDTCVDCFAQFQSQEQLP